MLNIIDKMFIINIMNKNKKNHENMLQSEEKRKTIFLIVVGCQYNSKTVNSAYITLKCICVRGNKTHCHRTVFKPRRTGLA